MVNQTVSSRHAFSAMLNVSRAVASGGSLDSKLDVIAEAAASVVVRATGASIVVRASADSDDLRLRGSYGLPAPYLHAVEKHPELFRQSASAVAIRQGRPIFLDEVEGHPYLSPAWHDLMRAAGIRSLLAAPLAFGNTVIGALCLYRSKPGGWTERDVGLVQFFSDHAASATRTASLMASLSDQVSALERVLRGLQEQNHEHANRLHALSGLLALEEYDEAVRFLDGLVDARDVATANVEATIDHPALAGLLLAETAIASQRGVRLSVSSGPGPIRVPAGLDDAQLVTIVGNLLDNAFDAVAELPPDRCLVEVAIIADHVDFRVEVRDRGIGLTGSLRDLRAPGRSTKPGHTGAGLALVDRIVSGVGGSLTSSSDSDSTTFVVTIPAQTGAVA